MSLSREALELQLNDLRRERREEAFRELLDLVVRGKIVFPEPRNAVNLHCHTSFSFNGYGYSPTYIAWKSRCDGLRVAGIVDFDVLDAVDEFLNACGRLGLRGCAGIETRVFVPQFATREINSPGEPGISYHMGVGFTSTKVPHGDLCVELKAVAQERNRNVATRVNASLDPVAVNYEKDVLPLTPNGNATERHLCMAYDLKAREILPDDGQRAAFWSSKLATDIAKVRVVLNDPPNLQALIRSKTMKSGGVGYVQPSGPDFPALDDVNAFVRSAGAIPTFAWLDGTTEGERAIDELFEVMLAGGAAAVNIIPDRNWNIKDPATKKRKMDLLYQFVAMARDRDMPIIVGTEMNAYGQRFVDDFDAPEMQPLTPLFVEGAHILYAHTILQAHAGMGYLSDWAERNFASAKEKNAFYQHLGKVIDPARQEESLSGITPAMTPKDLEHAKCQRRM
jgi:hypothetical protein